MAYIVKKIVPRDLSKAITGGTVGSPSNVGDGAAISRAISYTMYEMTSAKTILYVFFVDISVPGAPNQVKCIRFITCAIASCVHINAQQKWG